MHKSVIRLFLFQVLLLASFALAAPSPQATPANASLWSGNPLTGAVFLGPPAGCSSICSAANGQSCSPGPVGKIKSCFDVNYPDECGSCICQSNLTWSCSTPVDGFMKPAHP